MMNINSFTNFLKRRDDMIEIQSSKTADSRSCDPSKVSMNQLYDSSIQHIGDVEKGLIFFSNMLLEAIEKHDHDKLTDIEVFYREFVNNFKTTEWWDNHRRVNRHHLMVDDGVPKDVNLVDVIEMIVDCVMAGMARTGYVYPLEINPELLTTAFNNTVELLKKQVIIKE